MREHLLKARVPLFPALKGRATLFPQSDTENMFARLRYSCAHTCDFHHRLRMACFDRSAALKTAFDDKYFSHESSIKLGTHATHLSTFTLQHLTTETVQDRTGAPLVAHVLTDQPHA